MEFEGIGEVAETSEGYNKGSVEEPDEMYFEPELLEKYDRFMEGDVWEEDSGEGDFMEGDLMERDLMEGGTEVEDIKKEGIMDKESLPLKPDHELTLDELEDELDILFEEGDFFELPEEKDGEEDPQGQDEQDATDNRDEGEDPSKNCENSEKKGLTEEEKEDIRKRTGWSDEILDALGSKEEAEIYIKASLKEMEINGRKCLVRSDIDMNQKDEMGRTNKERAEQGLPPITKDGKTVELHHIGQRADGPLAELTSEEHRGKGNDAVLHDKTRESEIDRTTFARERSEHWKERAQKGEES